MARPWQENVHKFGIVEEFRKQGIGMILNLQEVRSPCNTCAADHHSSRLGAHNATRGVKR
jgi:hypothetical protein